jgi:hypothetical protein
MAYIGAGTYTDTISTGRREEEFFGNGVLVDFALDTPVPGGYPNNIIVSVNGSVQDPTQQYTITGDWNVITFVTPPADGAKIVAIHIGSVTTALVPSPGTVGIDELQPNLRNMKVDKFTGNGSQTVFTLSQECIDSAATVSVAGIVQDYPENFAIDGTTITFTSAPSSGARIKVQHLGFGTAAKWSTLDGTITTAKLDPSGIAPNIDGGTIDGATFGGTTPPTGTLNNITLNGTSTIAGEVINTGTSGLQFPKGTTAERPVAADGKVRYNSQTMEYEGYSNGAWRQIGGGQMLGQATVKAIFYNAQSIGENITVAADQNALSSGPITIEPTYTVTLAPGSRWNIT